MPFVSNISAIRERARKSMMDGAPTDGCQPDRVAAVRVLNEALAIEIVCVLRYKRHAFMAQGPLSKVIAAEFAEHAREEKGHADEIAARIVQLGGKPDFHPAALRAGSHLECVEGQKLQEMIQEDLVAERIAIDSYREMIGWFGDADTTTTRMLVGILATEEEHADELADLLCAG